jgi:DNA-binding MarR family transcriptional regulator
VKGMGQGSLPPPPAGVPDDELHRTANLLHSAALRLLRRVRAEDVGMDLDGPRASLLSVVAFRGPLAMSRLAEVEQVSVPAITKTVTLLERQGLVRRERSDADRRLVLVRATPEGRELLERGRAARVRSVAALLAGLPAEDRRTVGRAAALIGDLL